MNLNQALRLNPNLAEAQAQLGLIALDQGHTEQGIHALEKAVTLDPSLGQAHYRLGLAFQKLGNSARAKEELDRFRALKNEESNASPCARILSSNRPVRQTGRNQLFLFLADRLVHVQQDVRHGSPSGQLAVHRAMMKRLRQ